METGLQFDALSIEYAKLFFRPKQWLIAEEGSTYMKSIWSAS